MLGMATTELPRKGKVGGLGSTNELPREVGRLGSTNELPREGVGRATVLFVEGVGTGGVTVLPREGERGGGGWQTLPREQPHRRGCSLHLHILDRLVEPDE